jgi:hypothetical protein
MTRHKKPLLWTLGAAAIFGFSLILLYPKIQGLEPDRGEDPGEFIFRTQAGQILTKAHLQRKITVFVIPGDSGEAYKPQPFFSSRFQKVILGRQTLPPDWVSLEESPEQWVEIHRVFPDFNPQLGLTVFFNEKGLIAARYPAMGGNSKIMEKTLARLFFRQIIDDYLTGRTFFGPKRNA